MISKVIRGTRKFQQKLSKREITNIRTQNKFDTFYSELTTSLFSEHCNKKDHEEEKEKRKKKLAFRRNFQKIIAFRNHNKV